MWGLFQLIPFPSKLSLWPFLDPTPAFLLPFIKKNKILHLWGKYNTALHCIDTDESVLTPPPFGGPKDFFLPASEKAIYLKLVNYLKIRTQIYTCIEIRK